MARCHIWQDVKVLSVCFCFGRTFPERTVFFRYVPASPHLTRLHIEPRQCGSGGWAARVFSPPGHPPIVSPRPWSPMAVKGKDHLTLRCSALLCFTANFHFKNVFFGRVPSSSSYLYRVCISLFAFTQIGNPESRPSGPSYLPCEIQYPCFLVHGRFRDHFFSFPACLKFKRRPTVVHQFVLAESNTFLGRMTGKKKAVF